MELHLNVNNRYAALGKVSDRQIREGLKFFKN